MFDGFETRKVETGEATIHVRVGGTGPAVVLLHGYPQSGVCWHKLAPSLAERHRVIIPDLRGYGDSVGPPPDEANMLYSKRAMAGDVARVLDALSEDRAMIVITHYQRLLNYIVPDKVHVLSQGQIVTSGGKELALQLEASGYADFVAQAA